MFCFETLGRSTICVFIIFHVNSVQFENFVSFENFCSKWKFSDWFRRSSSRASTYSGLLSGSSNVGQHQIKIFFKLEILRKLMKELKI